MAFGIYVHIPYCLQRCTYCDFATYEKSSILPSVDYIELVKKEVHIYGSLLTNLEVTTIYFGGGTPSLVEAETLSSLLDEIRRVGFKFASNLEITIEINPATVSVEKLDHYLAAGINRFSVGAQTFREDLLKRVGRKHSASDTIATLNLLSMRNLNYSFDLLFALPGQSIADLENDLDRVQEFSPNHLSAYCLTVPDGHPLAKVRLPEDHQVDMFNIIESRLNHLGMDRYEISNFARPGYESKHNGIYWTDQPYWGIGLSAHSYFKTNHWGVRFWNPNNINQYVRRLQNISPFMADSLLAHRSPEEFEILTENQSLTDFCHIFLRTKKGLSLSSVAEKFGAVRLGQLVDLLGRLESEKLVEIHQNRWRLTRRGVLLSNQVFEACTFLK